MLEPKRVKYRKIHKPKIKDGVKELKVVFPQNGLYGLQILENGRISARCLEAARRVVAKKMKKKSKIWFTVFPDKSVTAKPIEVRMGKGKGAHDHWVCLVRKGRIVIEIDGLDVGSVVVKEALTLAGERLGLKYRVVVKKE